MMTQKILKASEVIDYADHHSGTLATSPGRLNPYKMGIELFRDIEDRVNGAIGRGSARPASAGLRSALRPRGLRAMMSCLFGQLG